MFMQPEITEKQEWYKVTEALGTVYLPAEDFISKEAAAEQAAEVAPIGLAPQVTTITGHGSRLSARGHLDATEWSVHDTIAEACDTLEDLYADWADENCQALDSIRAERVYPVGTRVATTDDPPRYGTVIQSESNPPTVTTRFDDNPLGLVTFASFDAIRPATKMARKRSPKNV